LIGLASSSYQLDRLSSLVSLVERRFSVTTSILSRRSGIVVRGPPRKTIAKGMVIGIGDVLCSSKPFTGGGLYAIAITAQHVARAAETGELAPLLAFWHSLYKKLRFQRFLTLIAKSIGNLWWYPLRLVCESSSKKLCMVDYDEHESLVECIARLGLLSLDRNN
ncbi:MAG: hypothetical protein ABWW69_05625, partial [Pyrodictiaceae archaeon]